MTDTNMEVGKVKIRSDKNEEEEDVMPPGFRFHPTDEELVGFYLQRKVEKKPLRMELIKQIDIYRYDPWDLPKSSNVEGTKEGYFFCIRGRKYRNSKRPNRVTVSGSGFWKATGIDKPVYGVGVRDIIGLKKSLVYYRGTAGKASKTDWMMHEFRLPQPNSTIDNHLQDAEVWTLCKIFERTPSYKKYTQAATKPTPSHSTPKTGSLGPDINGNPCLTFKDSLIIQQNDERKQFMNNIEKVEDERNHFFLGQLAQAPQPLVSYPSFWNPSVMEENVFANGNWDELRPMVQLAMDDPSNVYYDCTELYLNSCSGHFDPRTPNFSLG